MNPINLYLRLLNLLAFGLTVPLLCYAEGWVSAEAYAPVGLATDFACLLLPFLADAVDVCATLFGHARRGVRAILGLPVPF